MSILSGLLQTLRDVSALKAQVKDLIRKLESYNSQLINITDRVSRMETSYEHLKSNVKSEIKGEINADIREVQVRLEYEKGMLAEIKELEL